MKYCYQCGRLTSGEPLFCNFCGRSYDVKLCPRHHSNPRIAEVCSRCGSRELSTPQPKVSPWWRVLELLARVVGAVLLVYLSLTLLVAVLRTPQGQGGFIVIGILLGLLWWMWIELPEWFRRLVRNSWKRKERERER